MANTRRPKLSRDDLHALLIETGRTILREEGLGGGGEALTFKRVSDRVEADTGIRVTNASLIGRVWENQTKYQTDVLASIAADDSSSEIAQTVDGLESVLLAMDPYSEEFAERGPCVTSDGSRPWPTQEPLLVQRTGYFGSGSGP